MDEQKSQEIVMGLILHSGNAKSSAMEGIAAAKESDWETADQKIIEAEEELADAHSSQTELLTKEASGNGVDVSLLLVHAQDHLMTSITFCDLAKEFIDLYKNK